MRTAEELRTGRRYRRQMEDEMRGMVKSFF
jgi:hypothetical protein